jgi:hypothetical protein
MESTKDKFAVVRSGNDRKKQANIIKFSQKKNTKKGM